MHKLNKLFYYFFVVLFTAISPNLASVDVDSVYVKPTEKAWGEVFKPILKQNTFSKSYAIVIGIQDYRKGWGTLDAALTDVFRVRDYLIESDQFDFVVTLTNSKATKEKISYYMDDLFPSKIKSGDRFLFYFSGHGTQRKTGQFITGYIPLRNSHIDSFSTMISMDEFQRWDKLISEATHALFVLDCCFSGLAGRQIKANGKQMTIDRLSQFAHHLITAGTENEKSVASLSEWNGSLFTDSFLKGISGKADLMGEDFNEDGIVSLTELYAYIGQCIDNETVKSRSIKMSPQISELLSSDGEFFFISDTYKKKLIDNKSYSVSSKNVVNKDPGTVGFGKISIFSLLNGKLFLNGNYAIEIKADESEILNNQPEGRYVASLVSRDVVLNDTLFVNKGYTSKLYFLSPPTKTFESYLTKDTPIGSIRLIADTDSGKVFLDNNYMGYVNANDDFLINTTIVGRREIKIVNDIRTYSKIVEVPINGTLLLKLFNNSIIVIEDRLPPAAPTGLSIQKK